MPAEAAPRVKESSLNEEEEIMLPREDPEIPGDWPKPDAKPEDDAPKPDAQPPGDMPKPDLDVPRDPDDPGRM